MSTRWGIYGAAWALSLQTYGLDSRKMVHASAMLGYEQAIVNYWVDMEFTPVKTPKKSRELKDKGNQGEPRTARRRIMDRR